MLLNYIVDFVLEMKFYKFCLFNLFEVFFCLVLVNIINFLFNYNVSNLIVRINFVLVFFL